MEEETERITGQELFWYTEHEVISMKPLAR